MKRVFILLLVLLIPFAIVKANEDELDTTEEIKATIVGNTVSYKGKIAKFSVVDDIIELDYDGCTYSQRKDNIVTSIGVNEDCAFAETLDWDTINPMFDAINEMVKDRDTHIEKDNREIMKIKNKNILVYCSVPFAFVLIVIVVFVFLKESYKR